MKVFLLAWAVTVLLACSAAAALLMSYLWAVEFFLSPGLSHPWSMDPPLHATLAVAAVWSAFSVAVYRGIRALHQRVAGVPDQARVAKLRPALAAFFVSFFLWWAQIPGALEFAMVIRKSNEGATKGDLGALREALRDYRKTGDRIPQQLTGSVVKSALLQRVPLAKFPYYHRPSSEVYYGTTADDRGGWMYDNVEGDARFGEIWVNCTHTDTKGSAWSSY